jgi:hypothetical protein
MKVFTCSVCAAVYLPEIKMECAPQGLVKSKANEPRLRSKTPAQFPITGVAETPGNNSRLAKQRSKAGQRQVKAWGAGIIPWNLRLWFSLLLMLAFCNTSRAGMPDLRQNLAAASMGTGPQFAIADLDGDIRPDLASIQPGTVDSGATNYWIEVHLSTAGRESIHLFAPAGGLRIEARDVNGDHSVDLVLATAWFRQPVAILLNDGHGSFSQVDPARFPGTLADSTAGWTAPLLPTIDATGALPQSQSGACAQTTGSLHSRSPGRRISPSRSGYIVNSSPTSYAGRAPPSEVPRSQV